MKKLNIQYSLFSLFGNGDSFISSEVISRHYSSDAVNIDWKPYNGVSSYLRGQS